MTDIHCHILPAIDDGAANLEVSLAMARLSAASGVDTIIATPHFGCDDVNAKSREIMADSAVVSEQFFAIPENISVREDPDGIEYENHLLAAPDTGIAKIKLDGWEEALIEEESKRTDFVCWLRNPSIAAWALCLPYDIGGEKKSFYPDFLIVRSDLAVDYVVDILEPHGNQYADNLPKAKALAAYNKAEDRLGRIQLIHKTTDAGGTSKFIRLDLTDMAVRDKVLRAFSNDELDHIFETDGTIESCNDRQREKSFCRFCVLFAHSRLFRWNFTILSGLIVLP